MGAPLDSGYAPDLTTPGTMQVCTSWYTSLIARGRGDVETEKMHWAGDGMLSSWG